MEPVTNDEQIEDLYSEVPNPMDRPESEFQLAKLRELLSIYKEKLSEVSEVRPEEPWHPRATGLQYSNYEKAIGILEVAQFDNGILDKVFTVFTYLISESRLAKEYIMTTVVQVLNFYSEGVETSDQEGDNEVMFSRFLGFLGETFENLEYINSLVVNIIKQLHALFNKKQPKGSDLYTKYFKKSHLVSVFDALGSVLSSIAYVDAVIHDNETLKNHWELYKRMMSFAKSSPEKYNISLQQERQMRKNLVYLDRSIMSSSCLEAALNQKVDPAMSVNKELQAEFQYYFRVKLDKIYATLESAYEWDESYQVIDCVCLYILYRKLFPKEFDSKLFKAVWSLQKKAPAIVITGQVLIFPSELIINFAKPTKAVKVDPKDPNVFIAQYVQKSDENLPALIQAWNHKFSLWVTRMHNFLANNPGFSQKHNIELQENRGKLLLQGLLLANQIRYYFQLNTALHQYHDIPFKSNFIPCMMKGIDLIKAIGLTMDKKQQTIALYLGSMMKVFLHDTQIALKSVRDRTARERSDLLCAYRMISELSKGTLNSPRIDLLKLCTDLLDIKNLLKENERSVIADGMWKLEIMVNFQDNLKQATDCSFVYWIQELNSHFFQFIYKHPKNIHRLKYLFNALEDVVDQLHKCKHVEDPKQIEDFYIDERLKEFDEQLCKPLARDIESDLRLFIHSLYIKGLERQNPLEIVNISWFLESQPIIFCGREIDIKKKMEIYLEETFYNMTALSLNDWQVYEEMSSLAKQKFNLVLGENRLPSQQLDQGIGLLEITKRLQNFISKFKYNLHSQFFIEATAAENKSVACVTYMHIAKSLQTHGLGLVNTTINTSYKLLAKRFQIFSQFLYDEHIYSYLMKEQKYFESSKDSLGNIYPYDRPESFNKEIKRLGTFEGGASYIDKFRQLVTQIGNILGLIRTIKTAALNQTATKTEFIPNTQDIPQFADSDHQYSSTTGLALKTLDKINGTISTNFTEDTNYFSILVSTFQGVLNSTEAKHLKLFYMIIPTLMLNFVENLLIAKDKINKKKANDMYFTDDGFSMGLAYILRVLEQESAFDGLHWFDSIAVKFTQAEGKKKDDGPKMEHISMKKINVFREEFELLKYCFLGARIFFSQS